MVDLQVIRAGGLTIFPKLSRCFARVKDNQKSLQGG